MFVTFPIVVEASYFSPVLCRDPLAFIGKPTSYHLGDTGIISEIYPSQSLPVSQRGSCQVARPLVLENTGLCLTRRETTKGLSSFRILRTMQLCSLIVKLT